MCTLPLNGKVALVTGASRGIGKGVALVLAEQGADVVVGHFRTGDNAADSVADAIRAMGRKALLVRADVGAAPEVARMFEEIHTEFGRVDILVNNAGTTRAQDVFATTIDDWDFIVRTNLTSSFLCSKAAMESMRERNISGRIVFMSSIVGHRGALFGHVHYAATKSGMLGMVKTLARTGAPLGITVNGVAPGIIETELLVQTHGETIADLIKDVPLGCLGTPRDVGLAVAFLCGEGGRYITGATLDVNGGMYLR
ncbi:MAG: short-chain dehydrogenase [Lentisphaerae bacterium RIFOXYB12_FULL_65_16]|nr:MAG: short-chain dehydrogenase [Lentisphaerae bacterium RIFOXYA12_64_32]OGV87330.1 MAG: short-chain dehydrogenase [Lentisphaerae bacterium RIFOXYB12_FULL_65_16]